MYAVHVRRSSDARWMRDIFRLKLLLKTAQHSAHSSRHDRDRPHRQPTRLNTHDTSAERHVREACAHARAFSFLSIDGSRAGREALSRHPALARSCDGGPCSRACATGRLIEGCGRSGDRCIAFIADARAAMPAACERLGWRSGHRRRADAARRRLFARRWEAGARWTFGRAGSARAGRPRRRAPRCRCLTGWLHRTAA